MRRISLFLLASFMVSCTTARPIKDGVAVEEKIQPKWKIGDFDDTLVVCNSNNPSLKLTFYCEDVFNSVMIERKAFRAYSFNKYKITNPKYRLEITLGNIENSSGTGFLDILSASTLSIIPVQLISNVNLSMNLIDLETGNVIGSYSNKSRVETWTSSFSRTSIDMEATKEKMLRLFFIDGLNTIFQRI